MGLLELSKLYNVTKLDLIGKIYLPSSLPYIFTGLRLGAAAAWMSVVAAEMFASVDGLGYRITHAQTMMLSDMLLVDMIVIGAIGGMTDFTLRLIIKRFTRWQRA
jgi:sulfonate transport system permease protein